jgi:hypothetical protein
MLLLVYPTMTGLHPGVERLPALTSRHVIQALGNTARRVRRVGVDVGVAAAAASAPVRCRVDNAIGFGSVRTVHNDATGKQRMVVSECRGGMHKFEHREEHGNDAEHKKQR